MRLIWREYKLDRRYLAATAPDGCTYNLRYYGGPWCFFPPIRKSWWLSTQLGDTLLYDGFKSESEARLFAWADSMKYHSAVIEPVPPPPM